MDSEPGLRFEAMDVLKRLGPEGPKISLSSMWKSNAVRPVESGVVTFSDVDMVEILPLPSCKREQGLGKKLYKREPETCKITYGGDTTHGRFKASGLIILIFNYFGGLGPGPGDCSPWWEERQSLVFLRQHDIFHVRSVVVILLCVLISLYNSLQFGISRTILSYQGLNGRASVR